ncbi:hypothetical protein BH09MYX1_BH09MYX1_44530 [soil metagenome]
MSRLALLVVLAAGCRSVREPSPRAPLEAAASVESADAGATADANDANDTAALDASFAHASLDLRDAIGPYEAYMLEGRPVWYALPWRKDETRLIAHLHGQCAPPVFSCGQWLDAGAARGFVVCPTGNEHCTSAMGPAMWDESFALMDQDLEHAIAIAAKKTDGGFTRDGAVLTGFSRGGWAAIELVRMHPGRWPHLILIEADVTATAAILRTAKVTSLVMIAGEWGTELPGERKTVDALLVAGYRAKLLVMPKTAHLYSANIDALMSEALDFVTAD